MELTTFRIFSKSNRDHILELSANQPVCSDPSLIHVCFDISSVWSKVCIFRFQEKLKEFEKRLQEERKKRLEERKLKRKEDRRNKYIKEKEEEEQRKRDEALKRGEEYFFPIQYETSWTYRNQCTCTRILTKLENLNLTQISQFVGERWQ